jgi:hypothetical protein
MSKPKPPPTPPPNVIAPTLAFRSTVPDPPRNLGEYGRDAWDRLARAYGITDEGGKEVLYQSCAATDLAETLAAEVARDGAVIEVGGVKRSHPAIRDLLQARALAARMLKLLGLDLESARPTAGRPGAGFGWTGRK